MKSEFSLARVLIKAFSLFVMINLVYPWINPHVARISGYNVIFPGRTRLPFGITGDPYTITVENLDTMFASHTISARKATNEFRVALLGDSSVWGENLSPSEVISEQWNHLKIQCGDKVIKTYDLGYPHPSIMKDLVILDKIVEYDPDLIIWFVTLNSLISQRENPFLTANQDRVDKILDLYDIPFRGGSKRVGKEPAFFENTLLGQRSNLARQIKLQMLGIIWTATGADTNTLHKDEVPDFDVGDNPRYQGMQPPDDIRDMLLFGAVEAGHSIADPIPVLLVNEPIFVTHEADSKVRYNVTYPRWAYDQYRAALKSQVQTLRWNYLDLWNAIPPAYFSDAGLHLTAYGERLLIEQMNPTVQPLACGQMP